MATIQAAADRALLWRTLTDLAQRDGVPVGHVAIRYGARVNAPGDAEAIVRGQAEVDSALGHRLDRAAS